MAWTGYQLWCPSAGPSARSLLGLALLLLAVPSHCSPLLQEDGVTHRSETLEEPKNMNPVTPLKDNSREGVHRESGGSSKEYEQREAEEKYPSQEFQEEVSGESLEEQGEQDFHQRGTQIAPRRGRPSKQSVSRDLLNALREHRHQRYQQLERLQTLSDPEVADDENADDFAGVAPGVAPGVGAGSLSAIPPPGAVSPEQLGLSPSSMVRISGGSDRDRSSAHAQHKLDVIKGSRRAFNVTKLEYLKKEWCKTERFRQVVREEGCLRRVIINRFCYGQCNSFFIPKSNKHDPNSAAFQSCAFCKPRRTFSVTVTLVCPSRRQRLRRKKVDVVKQCKCMAQRLED